MSIPTPESLNSILATDCGSTTTKAILIERRGDEYRLIVRGEAPTTVEAPFEDVTRGVLNAIMEVEELAGRKILDGERIITPQNGERGRRPLHLDLERRRRAPDDGVGRGEEHDRGERPARRSGRRRDRDGRDRHQRRPAAAREDQAASASCGPT